MFAVLILGHHFALLHLTYEHTDKETLTALVAHSPYICGILPMLHWVHVCGGFTYPAVYVVAPKLVYMCVGGVTVRLVYWYHLPERWLPGRLDYFFTSYQLGNLLTLLLMVAWHNMCLYWLDCSLSGTLQCPFSGDLYARNYAKQVGSGSNLFFDDSGSPG